MEETTNRHALTRRSFLKTTGIVAGTALVLGGLSACDSSGSYVGPSDSSEELYSVMCRSNCMGSCRYYAHVRDDKIYKLTPAPYPIDGYRGSCLKGIAYVNRIYSKTRVKYPMRRAGERGEDQWERISWDEAVDEIATKMNDSIDKYGPESVIFLTGSGQYGYINGLYSILGRLSCVIGASKPSSSYDYAAGYGINRVLGTGDWYYCNEPNSVMDASLVVIWGTNPVLTAPQNWRWIQWAKENGTRVIDIDPMKSATAHRCDEWIQVIPGQDGYMALAMCNYLIKNDMINTKYLIEQSTACFLVRQDTQKHLRKSDYEALGEDEDDDFYVWDNATNGIALVSEAQDPAMEGSFTTPDGIKVDTAFSLLKASLEQYTIEEASEKTGVSQERIIQLAEEFATEEAVSVNITYGLDHYVNGYLNTWAVAILLALTGQFARAGTGFTGVFTQTWSLNTSAMWAYTPEFKANNAYIPQGILAESIETQKLAGKDFPLKVIFEYCGNFVGNMASQRDVLDKLLPNIDLWVTTDMEFNDSVRYSDIVLPIASWYEKEDVRVSYDNPYMCISEQAIEPLYESKPDWEIAALIGRAMGYTASFPESYTADDYSNLLFSDELNVARGFTLDRLREEKVIRFTTNEEGVPWVRGKDAPFPTETGRVQLYCENPEPRLDYGQDLSARDPEEHIVYYREPEEAGRNSELASKYPLVFIQEHSRFRVHTQWWEVPLLRELDPEPLAKISAKDAEDRGVKDDDIVEVFNDRGHAVLKCMIDESLPPGIIDIPKGWQRNQFIEGSFQELTQPKVDPYPSAMSYYDTRVDFRKWEEA